MTEESANYYLYGIQWAVDEETFLISAEIQPFLFQFQVRAAPD